MAYAVVQDTSGASTSSPVTCAFGSNNTAGNLIVLGFVTSFTAFGDVSSISDTNTNTYTSIQNVTGISNSNLRLYYAKNIGGGANTITVNTTGAQTYSIIAREYSGLDTTNPLDTSAGASGNSTAGSSGASSSTTATPELVLGLSTVLLSTSTVTAGAGFGNLNTVIPSTNQVLSFEDKRVISTGAQTATFTYGTSWNWGAIVANFRESGYSGGAPANTTNFFQFI